MPADITFFDSLLALFQWRSELWPIIGLSLRVSLSALIISTLIALPVAVVLATKRFPGSRFIEVLFNTLMGLPPVVVGLAVYLLVSRSGPLGVFGLLYSPAAMIIAQTILIIPIVVALSRQYIEKEYSRINQQLFSLGISQFDRLKITCWECRDLLLTVLLAGFGRAVAEVGAVMIVGGNIDNLTRVMTTAIVLETNKGHFEMALALGVVLLTLSLVINALIYYAGQSRTSFAH